MILLKINFIKKLFKFDTKYIRFLASKKSDRTYSIDSDEIISTDIIGLINLPWKTPFNEIWSDYFEIPLEFLTTIVNDSKRIYSDKNCVTKLEKNKSKIKSKILYDIKISVNLIERILRMY